MEHDPLCPESEDYYWRKKDCQCLLIAKARADEREKAGQRIQEQPTNQGDTP